MSVCVCPCVDGLDALLVLLLLLVVVVMLMLLWSHVVR